MKKYIMGFVLGGLLSGISTFLWHKNYVVVVVEPLVIGYVNECVMTIDQIAHGKSSDVLTRLDSFLANYPKEALNVYGVSKEVRDKVESKIEEYRANNGMVLTGEPLRGSPAAHP